MRAFFRRSVKVEVFTVFAKIEVEENRKDIQEFLKKLRNGKSSYEQRIQERVCEYLHRIGLLGAGNRLTSLGEYAYETGLVPYLEEGKYKLWCTLEDKLLGKRLLAFKREKPEKIKNYRNEESSYASSFLDELIEKRDLCLIIQEKREKNKWKRSTIERYCRVKKVASISSDKAHPTIEIVWIWDGLNNSHYELKGEINDFDKKQEINFNEILSVDTETCLLDLAKCNNWNWNCQEQKLMISFDNTPEETCETFTFNPELETSKFNYGKFAEAYLIDYPAMPDSTKSAEKWRNRRIENWLEQQYVNNHLFQSKMKEENQHESFSAYNLENVTVENFLHNLTTPGKKEKPISFWHLAAANDLNPTWI